MATYLSSFFIYSIINQPYNLFWCFRKPKRKATSFLRCDVCFTDSPNGLYFQNPRLRPAETRQHNNLRPTDSGLGCTVYVHRLRYRLAAVIQPKTFRRNSASKKEVTPKKEVAFLSIRQLASIFYSFTSVKEKKITGKTLLLYHTQWK
jgi:hypothetical protein